MRRFHYPVFREVAKNPKGKLLDISCGTGELLKALSKKFQHISFTGLDLSKEMLTVAQRKLPKSVVLKVGDVHNLPFHSGMFDFTVNTEAFHHYYDQQKALSEMVRVTKSKGEVIIVDVNFFIRGIHVLFRIFEPGHSHINSRKEMHKLFAQASLKNVRQRRFSLFSVGTVGVKP